MAGLPLILFGACDRHNFGDLLLPHLLALDFPGREIHVAGLADRDLREFGGHRVRALPALLRELAAPVELVHAGGEILTTGLWEAAVMLATAAAAERAIRACGDAAARQRQWAEEGLGCSREAPYVIGRDALPAGSRLHFCGVGGVGLADFAGRGEVFAALRSADSVSVRDGVTGAVLAAAGIRAALRPDPVEAIARSPSLLAADRRAAAAIRAAFPGGYLALQLSAELGDDATLTLLAGRIDALATRLGLGVVLFLAGAAPWHDDPAVLARLAARLTTRNCEFGSLDIRDIGALIAGARLAIGSSLHVRIVAGACGVPALSLATPTGAAKIAAYVDSRPPDAAPVFLTADVAASLALPPTRSAAAR